jgi:hypothetical protein
MIERRPLDTARCAPQREETVGTVRRIGGRWRERAGNWNCAVFSRPEPAAHTGQEPVIPCTTLSYIRISRKIIILNIISEINHHSSSLLCVSPDANHCRGWKTESN